MLTIYKKDMHTYFTTFTGYLFIACIVLVGGIYTYLYNMYYSYATFETAINNLPFFFIFLIPVVASGIFTEEKKQKTDQLLYTLPLKSSQIVLGKFFALATIMAIPMVIMMAYPVILSLYGEVNFLIGYANLLAVFLLALSLASISMFISALCENMIVSAVVSFGLLYLLSQMTALADSLSNSAKQSFIGFVVIAVLVLVFLWYMTRNIYIAVIPALIIVIASKLMMSYNLTLLSGKIKIVFNGLALFSRLDMFLSGVFDISAIVYYLAVIALFVLLSIYTFERRRWI